MAYEKTWSWWWYWSKYTCNPPKLAGWVWLSGHFAKTMFPPKCPPLCWHNFHFKFTRRTLQPLSIWFRSKLMNKQIPFQNSSRNHRQTGPSQGSLLRTAWPSNWLMILRHLFHKTGRFSKIMDTRRFSHLDLQSSVSGAASSSACVYSWARPPLFDSWGSWSRPLQLIVCTW